MAASRNGLLAEQIDYYRARANEYDEWFLRQGRYDHGPMENAAWHAEVDSVAAALDVFLRDLPPDASVLELAAGTGLWTQRLAEHTRDLTVLDAAPEALDINQRRLGARAADIQYQVVDLFAWRPARAYDLVFFSFWLSHVPPARFADFWALARTCVAPGGHIFFIDSRYTQGSTARDHRLEGSEATAVTRRLNDGSEYRIVKVFHTPERLTAELAALGWQSDIHVTTRYFLYGSAVPTGQSG